MSLSTNDASLWYADLSEFDFTLGDYYYMGGRMKWTPAVNGSPPPARVDEQFGYGGLYDSTNGQGLRIRHLANDSVDRTLYCQMISGGAIKGLLPDNDGEYDLPENGIDVWIAWMLEMRLRENFSAPAWFLTVMPYLYTPSGGAWYSSGTPTNLAAATDYTDIDALVFAGLGEGPASVTFDEMNNTLVSDLFFIANGAAPMTTAQRNQLITKAPHLVLGSDKVPGYWRCKESLANYGAGSLGPLIVGAGGTTAYNAEEPTVKRAAGGPRHLLQTALDLVRGRPPYLRSQSLMR